MIEVLKCFRNGIHIRVAYCHTDVYESLLTERIKCGAIDVSQLAKVRSKFLFVQLLSSSCETSEKNSRITIFAFS